jgi:phage baseplate assembly protein W
MAIEIKIHPLDFEPDVAIGIDLPMMAGTGAAFKLNYTTLDQAVANAKNLLLTNRGERIMQPDFGCDLRNTLFENLTEDLITKLEDRIKSNFDYWLPYIFINELSIVPSEDQNRIYVSLTISLEGNKFDTRSIQLEVINEQ